MGIIFSMPAKSAQEKANEKLINAVTYSSIDCNVEAAKEAIEEGANVNSIIKKSRMFNATVVPLWEALKENVFFGVKTLLEYGANPNYTDNRGISLLMYCAGAHLPGITYVNLIDSIYCELLIKHGANVNQKSPEGFTALDYAFRDSGPIEIISNEIIDVLLKNGATISNKTVDVIKSKLNTNHLRNKEVLKIAKKRGMRIDINPVLQATIFEDFETANKLIAEKNFDKNRGELLTLVAYSILGNSLDTLKLLETKGFKVENQLTSGKSTLTFAAENGKLDIVKYLIEEKGVNPDGLYNSTGVYTGLSGEFALSKAVLNNHYEVAKYLIEKGAQTYHAFDRTTRLYINALVDASQTGNLELVKLVFNHTPNLSEGSIIGAIENAARNNNYDIIEFLTKDGFDFKTKMDIPYRAPDNFEMMDYLLKKGVNINGKDNKGHQLEHYCEEGNIETVRYFISKGADVNTKISAHVSALKSAIKRGHFDIVKLLVENGAKVDVHTILKAEEAGSTRILEYLKSKMNVEKNSLDKVSGGVNEHNQTINMGVDINNLNGQWLSDENGEAQECLNCKKMVKPLHYCFKAILPPSMTGYPGVKCPECGEYIEKPEPPILKWDAKQGIYTN